ncbi:hypothetical protein JOC76_005844 [Neobacillus cucumis]|nr:hypothetical protein [Neobacillus cucumis]
MEKLSIVTYYLRCYLRKAALEKERASQLEIIDD